MTMASQQRRPENDTAGPSIREGGPDIPSTTGSPTPPELLSARGRTKIRDLLNGDENFGITARSFVESIPIVHQFEACCYIISILLKVSFGLPHGKCTQSPMSRRDVPIRIKN